MEEDGSFTDHLIQQEKQNEECKNNLNATNNYDSSEYHPDQFGLGTFSQKVLEEIREDHDGWENFMTNMFLLGIILIPLQLIFADNLKTLDIKFVQFIQSFDITKAILAHFEIRTCLAFTSSMTFFMSFTVFFYMAFDNGIAVKASLVCCFSAFVVFIFKLIIHDGRPYWLNSDVMCGICKFSFGAPSLDVFIGMIYSHYMHFCTERALMSDDHFINQNRRALEISKLFTIGLMLLNYINGIFYVAMGVNYTYQIIISYFYGFIVIRIVQVFNKEIDSFVNGARYIMSTSNVLFVYVIFFTIGLSILSSIVYSTVGDQLIIERQDIINIERWCTNVGENTSIKFTYLESASLFYIVGVVAGINYVLRHLRNYNAWIVSPLWVRFLRGVIGFWLNVAILSLAKKINVNILANCYFVLLSIFVAGAFVSFGFLPICFSYLGLANLVTPIDEKKLKHDEEENEMLFKNDPFSHKKFKEDELMQI